MNSGIQPVLDPGKDPPDRPLLLVSSDLYSIGMELEVETSLPIQKVGLRERKRVREEEVDDELNDGAKSSGRNREDDQVGNINVQPVWISGPGVLKKDQLEVYDWLSKEIGDMMGRRLQDGTFLVKPNSERQRLQLLRLTSWEGEAIQVYGKEKATSLQGIVRGVDRKFDEEKLLSRWESQGVVKVRFLNSKKKSDLSEEENAKLKRTVVLTFQGPSLPGKIRLGFEAFTVYPFTPAPIRCFKCQMFGHVQAECRRNVRCERCSGNHEFRSCLESPQEKRCANCKGRHEASSLRCPARAQALEVVRVVQDTGKGYMEAKREIRQRGALIQPSYSDVVREPKQTSRHIQSSSHEGRHENTPRLTSDLTTVDDGINVDLPWVKSLLGPLLSGMIELLSVVLHRKGPIVQALKAALRSING